ncbi:zinc knuckle [Ostertagia ostertagi]
MLAALDAAEGHVYEEVRRVAMRLERLQPDASRFPTTSSNKGDHANATNGRRYNGNTVGGISLADKVEGWCKTVRMKPNLGSTQPQAMAKALVDTGSVVSIVPVGLLKQARDQGVDLDNQASVVGDGKQRKLIDASEIVTEVSVPGASTACVHMHVQQSKDNTLLLGTNALFELGISLKLSPRTANRDCPDEDASLEHGSFSNLACANKRVVIAPGTVSTVQIKSFKRQGACVLWSRNPCIESGVCHITEGKAEISVVNRGNESWVINKGENIGEWSADTWVDPRIADIPGDMLCLHQSSEPEGAERTDLLIATLDTNRRAGPMPREVREVVVEFSEVFAISDTELTQTTLVQHDIDIGEHPPIKQKTRPVPYGIRDKVHTMLQDLKERNVIEDSQSPWASPIVLVAKKDGTTRLCVDYREVNKTNRLTCHRMTPPPCSWTLKMRRTRKMVHRWTIGKRSGTKLYACQARVQQPRTAQCHLYQVTIGSPHMSDGQPQHRIAPSRAWSRQSSPESSQGRSNGESMSLTTYGSRHRLNGEDRVDNMFTVFREVFKAQSVANVPKYNGKNSLTDFLRALDVKFPSTVWGDSDRRDILVNHLEGTALSLVKGLPLAIREGSFFDVVDALKAARRNPCERLKNDSYHMLAALDAAEGHVYEEVRRVAMRLERLQPDASRFPTTSSNKGGIDRKAINATHVDSGARLGAGSKADRPPLKCFNCGGIGHSAYKCKKPKRPFQQRDHVDHANATNGRRYNGNTVGGISLADKVEGWCKTVRMKPNLGSTQPQAMGKPCTCDVKIFGISAKALVDTGSVVSIVPVGLLKQARDQGVDLDNQASVVGDGKQRKLIDASGNPMSFLSEIVTEVSVPGASTACVHMHVQQSKDNTLLLGTNALFELGISLKLSPRTANRDCPDEDASLEHGSFSNLACANKRVVIAPGTVSTVQIKSFKRQGACVLWSRNPCIESGVCHITEGKAEISVVNRGNESWVINKGENIGEWSADTWVDPRIADIPGDMLCLHQSSEPEGAERTDLLIATLDTNRRAGPMPREVREVVVEFSEVFAISDTELTQTTLVQHDIDIGEHPPIKQKTRPVPYGIRDKVHTMLQDLKERNVIEDSQSPWASPIVLVAKKDGTTRLCVDYREVNKVTKKDSYPLPPIDITLQNLQGKRCSIKSSSSNVRHIDWKCPGEMLINGQRVACTVNVPISNLLPSAPLSSFAFQSPYELARAFAVISQTHVPEHFRLARMLDSSYDIVTPTSVGLAIAFYRSHCIHMTFAAVEDTAKITPGYPPRSNSDPYNLPSIYSDAVKFADMHPWTATSWKLLQPRRTLVILPEGFQDVLECFESSLMSARLAREPDDVQPRWFEEEFSAVIIFSPARFVEVSRWRSAWFLIMQAVARGAELIALAGPKDDQDWGKAVDQLRDIIEETITQRPSLKRRNSLSTAAEI